MPRCKAIRLRTVLTAAVVEIVRVFQPLRMERREHARSPILGSHTTRARGASAASAMLQLFQRNSATAFPCHRHGAAGQPPATQGRSEVRVLDLHLVRLRERSPSTGDNDPKEIADPLARHAKIADVDIHPRRQSCRGGARCPLPDVGTHLGSLPPADAAGSECAALRDDTVFALAMIDELSGCYRAAVKSQKNLKLRNGFERLAAFLLQMKAQARSAEFELPFDKRTLASLSGMTAENLSRAFATLRPYGVVVNGARIGLADGHDLERLAKPAPLIDGSDSVVD